MSLENLFGKRKGISSFSLSLPHFWPARLPPFLSSYFSFLGQPTQASWQLPPPRPPPSFLRASQPHAAQQVRRPSTEPLLPPAPQPLTTWARTLAPSPTSGNHSAGQAATARAHSSRRGSISPMPGLYKMEQRPIATLPAVSPALFLCSPVHEEAATTAAAS